MKEYISLARNCSNRIFHSQDTPCGDLIYETNEFYSQWFLEKLSQKIQIQNDVVGKIKEVFKKIIDNIKKYELILIEKAVKEKEIQDKNIQGLFNDLNAYHKNILDNRKRPNENFDEFAELFHSLLESKKTTKFDSLFAVNSLKEKFAKNLEDLLKFPTGEIVKRPFKQSDYNTECLFKTHFEAIKNTTLANWKSNDLLLFSKQNHKSFLNWTRLICFDLNTKKIKARFDPYCNIKTISYSEGNGFVLSHDIKNNINVLRFYRGEMKKVLTIRNIKNFRDMSNGIIASFDQNQLSSYNIWTRQNNSQQISAPIFNIRYSSFLGALAVLTTSGEIQFFDKNLKRISLGNTDSIQINPGKKNQRFWDFVFEGNVIVISESSLALTSSSHVFHIIKFKEYSYELKGHPKKINYGLSSLVLVSTRNLLIASEFGDASEADFYEDIIFFDIETGTELTKTSGNALCADKDHIVFQIDKSIMLMKSISE